MKKALYAGTFDPPTLGHMHIIERALDLCDQLIIGIGENTSKRVNLFSFEERQSMLNEITKHISNIKIVVFRGLLVDCAQKYAADFLIRGLRTSSDFDREFPMALANRRLGNLETVFLCPDEEHMPISSTLIREISFLGGSIKDFVPHQLEELIHQRIMQQKASV